MCSRSGFIEEKLGRKKERKASHCSSEKAGSAKGEIQTDCLCEELSAGQGGLGSRTSAVVPNHWLTEQPEDHRTLAGALQ